MAPRLHRVRREADPAPQRRRGAAPQLAKHGDIPTVNTLVDIGNLVSTRHALPVAVFDLAGITGAITVRFATGAERFTDLGSSGSTSPSPGEVVFVDRYDVVSARRWCWPRAPGAPPAPRRWTRSSSSRVTTTP